MDVSIHKSSAGSSVRKGNRYSYYSAVMNGEAQAAWANVGPAWTEGSGYLEKIGNGFDYGYHLAVVSKSNFEIHLEMSISDLTPGSTFLIMQDQTTTELFYSWLNADVGGESYLATISNLGTWGGIGYDRLDSYVTSGGKHWQILGRRGSVFYWRVLGDLATFGVERAGMTTDSILSLVLPGDHTVRIYNYFIGA